MYSTFMYLLPLVHSPHGNHARKGEMCTVCLALLSYRSEGPVLLNQHNGCVSSCDFSRDGKVYMYMYV